VVPIRPHARRRSALVGCELGRSNQLEQISKGGIRMTTLSDRRGALVVGGGLIVVGLLAAVISSAHIDPSQWLGGSGWTLFIVIPGIALFASGLLSRGEPAQALTIAGAIVTTVGLMLLVMDQTDHYQSWAYAWALIPAAAGLAVALHGVRTDDRPRTRGGLRVTIVSLGILVVGAWFFETIFRTGEPPFGLELSWPFALIVVGIIVVVLAILRRPAEHRGSTAGR
jgi:FtsH-binding integral membrane protein